jgi:hypothetical protein
MVCDDLNGSVSERRVNDEEVCQAEPEVFGPPEAGYQVQFLSKLVMPLRFPKAGSRFGTAKSALFASGRRCKLRVQPRKTRLGISVYIYVCELPKSEGLT